MNWIPSMCQRQFLGYHYKSLILKYRMCFNVGFGLFEAQIIHFLASGRPSYCFLSLRYNTALNGSTKVDSTGPLVIGNWFVSSFFLLGSAAVNSLCRCFFFLFWPTGVEPFNISTNSIWESLLVIYNFVKGMFANFYIDILNIISFKILVYIGEIEHLFMFKSISFSVDCPYLFLDVGHFVSLVLILGN